MFKKLMLLAILPFAVIAGIFQGIYSVFVPPRDTNSRRNKERRQAPLRSSYPATAEFPRGASEEGSVTEKRLPVPADFLKGAVFATFGPRDLEENNLRELAADDERFAAEMEELDQFCKEQAEEFRKEAELDKQIDDLATVLETRVDILDITEYDGE